MARIAVLIGAPGGSRLLASASASEREIALMVESVPNRIAPSALPVSGWIHCANTAILRRLTAYFAGVQDERANNGTARGSASPLGDATP